MESRAITDGQISASSQYSVYNAPNHGRLNGQKILTVKEGAWSPATSDVNQWFQIDLGSTNITVTRVATQGRNGHHQCVDKYKLQYSDDEGNFQYYKEQGQAIEKVSKTHDQVKAAKLYDINLKLSVCHINVIENRLNLANIFLDFFFAFVEKKTARTQVIN